MKKVITGAAGDATGDLMVFLDNNGALPFMIHVQYKLVTTILNDPWV